VFKSEEEDESVCKSLRLQSKTSMLRSPSKRVNSTPDN